MKRIELRREMYLKDKNANVKIPMGIAFSDGYKQALRDAAAYVKSRTWLGVGDKVEHLGDEEVEP